MIFSLGWGMLHVVIGDSSCIGLEIALRWEVW